MPHRHIETPAEQYNQEAIESILERGTDNEVLRLFKTLKAEPWGGTSEQALTACKANRYYAWSSTIPRLIHRWRLKTQKPERQAE